MIWGYSGMLVFVFRGGFALSDRGDRVTERLRICLMVEEESKRQCNIGEVGRR